VAAASVYACRVGQGSDEQQQRVERWLVSALTRQPSSPMVRAALADLHNDRGRYAEAVAGYREVLQAGGRRVEVLNNLAYLLALTEDRTTEALELVNAAIDVAGPHPELLDTSAVVHLKRNRPTLAIRDLQQAIAASPSAMKYAHLAMAHAAAKDHAAAAQALRQATGAGFTAADLHPLERQIFHDLLGGLGVD
jgi:Tfp pilus assembly protein PilF